MSIAKARIIREEAEFGYSPSVGNKHASKQDSREGHTTTCGDGMGGRNLRNVWVINPQPFPDAHFATFPEALVEPLIKCSTSDKGVCPECGGQWARVIDSERIATRPTDTPYKDTAPEANKDHGRHVRESTTLGWRPTCACHGDGFGECPPYIPATVLDPFLGSGTTLLVARKLGRNGIGIELSSSYADMARKRIGEYAPLFNGGNQCS